MCSSCGITARRILHIHIGIVDSKTMDIKSRYYGHLRYRAQDATHQFRLTALIVMAVLVVLSAGMFVDYHCVSRQHVDAIIVAFEVLPEYALRPLSPVWD